MQISLFTIFLYRIHITKKVAKDDYNDFLDTKTKGELKHYLEKDFLEKNRIYIECVVMTIVAIMGVVVSITSVRIEQKVSDIESEQLALARSNVKSKIDVNYDKEKSVICITNWKGNAYHFEAAPVFYFSGYAGDKKIYLDKIFECNYDYENQQIQLIGNDIFENLEKLSEEVQNLIEKYNHEHINDEIKIPELYQYVYIECTDSYASNDMYYNLDTKSLHDIYNQNDYDRVKAPTNIDILLSLEPNEKIEDFAKRIAEEYIKNILQD